MYGLCRVRSSAIEGLAALININSEQQSGDAGAAIKLDLRLMCDGVQMSTCVYITHHSQILGIWRIGESILASAILCIMHNIQFSKLSLLGTLCTQ